MQETNEMRDRLINEFAENYMEKLFYFCLKKTGSHIEAEDLTQDIALQIIIALNKGTLPTSFSAWVWQIARNRYSVWAKEKHNRNESVTGSDISDYAFLLPIRNNGCVQSAIPTLKNSLGSCFYSKP